MSLTDRQRAEHRAWHEKIEAEEAQEREARERPIREATQELARTHGKVLQLQQQRVQSGKDSDFNLAEIDPEMVSVSLSKSEATEFNGREAELFTQREPRYKACPASEDAMLAYAERNGLQVVSAKMWQAIFDRLLELNLIEERQPEPDPEPEPELPPEPQQHPEHGQRLYDGWDQANGNPRQFTEWEVRHMTADQFRIALRIPIVNRPGARAI
jgi:hypothetical protein